MLVALGLFTSRTDYVILTSVPRSHSGTKNRTNYLFIVQRDKMSNIFGVDYRNMYLLLIHSQVITSREENWSELGEFGADVKSGPPLKAGYKKLKEIP